MAYQPYRGATLLIPYNNAPHLFAVLNDPCKDGLCLLVMLTSIKEGRVHDPACTFAGGEHEFINKPSYILYRMAEHVMARHISNMVEKGYYTPKADLDAAQLARVTAGLFDSEETRLKMIKYATACGL